MSLLPDAKKILLDTGSTFVFLKGDLVFSSKDRGVSPILGILAEEGEPLNGAVVADRVIGKAAALLLVYGKIDRLYAAVISRLAANVLDDHGITYEYDKMVPNIINRDGTDMCPMEKLVLAIDDPTDAYRALLAKVRGG